MIIVVAACHVQQTDPLTRIVAVNGVKLSVRRDASWMSKSTQAYEGFRIRVDYPADRSFTKDQLNQLDYGMQASFAVVRDGDTVAPVFIQRVADGIAHRAEYVAAFEKGATPMVTLLFADNVFGLGAQTLKW